LKLSVSYLAVLALLLMSGQGLTEESPWTVEPLTEDNASSGQALEGIDILPYREFIRDGPASEVFEGFDPSGSEPSLLVASGMAIPWGTYRPLVQGPQLWIEGMDSWAQHVALPQDGFLDLIAFSSREGQVVLSTFSSTGISRNSYSLAVGYQKMTVQMAVPGRSILLLDVDGQLSNAVVVDVIAARTEDQGVWSLPDEVLKFSPGNAVVKIVSESIKGYDVYVDGVYNRNEGGDGAVDGMAILPVKGNKIHTIAVSLRGEFGAHPFRREFNREFESGYLYILQI